MSKDRLDTLMVERGIADSRSQAQRLVMAGQVRVDGQVVLKPSTHISAEALIEIDQGPPFVSRGGEKLEAALATFYLEVSGWICADVGASTGGFTDCLLQNGAERVYAIDVGQGILHWKLRQDPRVVVMERTNARYVERLPEPVDLVTIDASFISLKLLLPIVKGWFSFPSAGRSSAEQAGRATDEAGRVIALIKPQFEAGKAEVKRGGGVIRDPAIHRQVLLEVIDDARQEGYGLLGLMRSPLLGPKGNVEFLGYFGYPDQGVEDVMELVEQVFSQ